MITGWDTLRSVECAKRWTITAQIIKNQKAKAAKLALQFESAKKAKRNVLAQFTANQKSPKPTPTFLTSLRLNCLPVTVFFSLVLSHSKLHRPAQNETTKYGKRHGSREWRTGGKRESAGIVPVAGDV